MAAPGIRLNIVTALECEALPLIRRLGLVHVPGETVRPLYLGKGIALTISGPGRRAAEFAVKFLNLSEAVHYAIERKVPKGSSADVAWLNVGIGGHRDRPVGQGILAHRVEDAGWSRAWYPRFVFDAPCPTETVRSIDHVERNYLDPVVYEMEAAGFAASASQSTPAELIHVYKVISDGLKTSVNEINPGFVEELIEARVEEIAVIAETLANLSDEIAGAKAPPEGFEELNARLSFTQTQQHQLRRLLVRWEALKPEVSLKEAGILSAHSAREALLLLQSGLSDSPPSLGRERGRH